MAYYILKSYKLNRLDPFKIFEVLSTQRHCFFLDTSLSNFSESLGRYSILGIEPFFILKSKGNNPFPGLRELLNKYKIRIKTPLPFFGGAVGFLAYDLGLVLEKKIKPIPKMALEIPDSFFGFYNTAVIIDHLKKILYIIAIGLPELNSRLGEILAKANFKKISYLLSQLENSKGSLKKIKKKIHLSLPLKSNFTKIEYCQAIKKAKQYIKAGDIYQVNLSQQFKTKTSLSSFQIYKRLRKVSPSCFSAYLDCEDFQILSSSPESFLRLKDNLVTTRPMKGTRPRGKNRIQDLSLKKELLGSIKDKAELTMIVDLQRNDLGRVCSYNSVKVSKLRRLEEYRTVFQTTATIQGHLHPDKDRLDLLRACFPGGSITGCPKIRAMEIIEELEPTRRSIYTGSLGYLSFSQDMDFNILIRSILKKEDNLCFGAGGGIVADSKPEEEYGETLVKAKAMIEAIS